MKTRDIEIALNKLTNIVEKMTPPIPAIPAIPPIPPINNPLDHDLLTKLDTKVDQIQSDVTDLKKQGNQYITLTQHEEVVKCNEKQQVKIESLETFRDTLIGKMWGISVIVGIFVFIITYVVNHIKL